MRCNLKVKGKSIQFIWVPGYVVVERNEKLDILAKQTLKLKQIGQQVPLSKTEAKVTSGNMCNQ